MTGFGLVYGLTELVHGWYLWPLVGCTATTTYLLILTAQFHLATHRAPEPEPAPVGNVSAGR